MGAAVSFVVGRCGCGKSHMFFQEIRDLVVKGERVVLLVPEQFTFETERALSKALPGGIWNAAVYSFTTLAQKVTEGRRVYLSRQGRRMVIRRILDQEEKRLLAFGSVAKKPGFSAQCDEIFSLCKRFLIPPEQLRAAAESME